MRFSYDSIHVEVTDLPARRRSAAGNRIWGYALLHPDGRWRWHSLARRATMTQRRLAGRGAETTIHRAVHEVRFSQSAGRDIFTLHIGEPVEANAEPDDPRTRHESWTCVAKVTTTRESRSAPGGFPRGIGTRIITPQRVERSPRPRRPRPELPAVPLEQGPAGAFLADLRTAVLLGDAHIADRGAWPDIESTSLVGAWDGERVLLLPARSIQAAIDVDGADHRVHAISAQLAALEIITADSHGRRSTRARIGGRPRRVWDLPRTTLQPLH